MKTIFLAVLQTLIGFLAPVYMLFICAFGLIKWNEEPSYVSDKGADDPHDNSFIRRGRVRFNFLKWVETPDMPLPGGMYEPTVKNLYGEGSLLKALLTSYVWLGLRNRAHGLAAMWGHATTDYIPNPFSTDRSLENWTIENETHIFKRDEDWQVWKPIFLGFYMVYGFESHRKLDGTFVSYNHFTFKRKPV
jgi:hypothetical protein